jgi:disulfide bond formation protein DsbB
MTKDMFRLNQTLWFLLSLFVISASCYFQWIKGLEPCPLCLMQRFCVLLLLLLSFSGIFIKNPGRRKGLLCAELIIGLAGLYFAGRQIWLQQPPIQDLPACLPGLDILLRYFPWSDILQAFFFGAADCHEVSWQWLGLSMAAWSSVYFLLFFGNLLIMFRQVYSVEKTKG